MRTPIVIAVLFVCITGSAYAADWNFYGSARVNTAYTKFDADPFSSNAAIFGMAKGSDTSNYEQRLYGSARIGAKVKANDQLTGRFEFGALGGNANLRILWGEWNFGAGTLTIGQDYTPLFFPYANQTYSFNGLNKGDHNMSTFGMLYGNRKPLIRLKFGNFQIAAVQPSTLVSVYGWRFGGAAPAAAQPNTEVKLPSIQAKYKYDFNNGHVSVAAGYQTFDFLSGTNEYKVDSYVLGIGGRLDIGQLYLKGNVWGGQNVGNLADVLVNGGLYSTAGNAGTNDLDGDGRGYARYTDGSIPGTTVGVTERDALAALAVAGYAIRKGLYLEAGYGYVRTELESAGSVKDDVASYYLNSTIFLAPGVFITPEIGRIDFKQTNQPVATYYSIKWQINF